MNAISPVRTERAMSEAMQAVAMLGDDADDRTLIAAIEAGGGDIFAVLDRVAESAIADRLLAEAASGRADRLEARAGHARDLIRRIMEALELTKLERPVFTASLAKGPQSVVVTDPTAIPEPFLRQSPDKALIGKALKAGQAVPGATLSNGMPALRLLTR